MSLRKLAMTMAVVAIATLPLSASAGETPRGLWIKMKCALCHGEDGASNTPAGKQKGAPDLRTEQIQKLKDDELLKPVYEGHAGIPAFKSNLPKDHATMLVSYIRIIAEKKK